MKNKILKKIKPISSAIVLFVLVSNIFATQTVAPTLPQVANPISTVVELQVNSESEDERKQTFIKALDQILTKNSGNPKITSSATIKAALLNPSIYIQSYTYVTRNTTNTFAKQQTLFLQIQFDQAAIKQLLQQASQPTQQNPNKQQVLVWLVKVTTSGNKIIEDESSNDVIIPILKKSAQDFGGSIIFPISDLQDAGNIKADDICNLNATTIKEASQRYKASTIVAGCVKEPTVNNVWTSQWLLLRDDRSDTFNFSGTTIDSIIMQAMGTIAPTATGIVKKQSTGNQAKKLTLRITNVSGLNQYNEVVRYLVTLSQIAQIDLVKIGPTEVEMSINIKNDQQALVAALDTQNRLVRNTNPQMGIDLDYKWVVPFAN